MLGFNLEKIAKIFSRVLFVQLVLLVRVVFMLAGEEAWVPMVCENGPAHVKLSVLPDGAKSACNNPRLKELQGDVSQLASLVGQLKNRWEKLSMEKFDDAATSTSSQSQFSVNFTKPSSKGDKCMISAFYENKIQKIPAWRFGVDEACSILVKELEGEISRLTNVAEMLMKKIANYVPNVTEVTSTPISTVEDATDTLSTTATTTGEEAEASTTLDSVWYGGKRFVAFASEKVYKAEAVSKCQNLGGELANVYSQSHMDTIMNYIHQYKLDGSIYKWFYLGMKYDPINEILRLLNGTQVSINDYKWYSGYPHNGASYASATNMFIEIDSDPSDAQQYLANGPDINVNVLCEI